MKRIAPALLLLVAVAAAAEGTDVELLTADGMTIAGTYWPGPAEYGPAVVLLHMYRSNRAAYAPLVPHLLARRMSVLAIDMRGHGDSRRQKGNDLGAKVSGRDAALFNAMHEDAIAAVRWLVKEKGHDGKHIGLVGASVGCSVALDTAQHYPTEVAAVLCLTPGSNYLGVNSIAHAAKMPKSTAIMLVSHKDEAAGGARPLHQAIAGSALRIVETPYPAGASRRGFFHGTRMFGKVPLVEPWVAGFLAHHLGSVPDAVLLDGDPAEDAWKKATPLEQRKGGQALAYRVGRRVVFGGFLPAGESRLRLKIRAWHGDVDWDNLAKGVMSLKTMEDMKRYKFLSILLEAPNGFVRDDRSNWGSPPHAVAIAFRPRDGGVAFEGEATIPEFLPEQEKVVELAWNWEAVGARVKPIRGGLGAELDLDGQWVRVDSR